MLEAALLAACTATGNFSFPTKAFVLVGPPKEAALPDYQPGRVFIFAALLYRALQKSASRQPEMHRFLFFFKKILNASCK
jgi:hypothetical protein